MKDTLIIIPARYSSTRLPAKVLAEIEGKPIIEWVYTACKNAKVGDVLIATENKKIVEAAKKFGAKAVLTSNKCQSGTDRVYEAYKSTKKSYKYVINVQGDEPFVQASTIKNVVKLLKKDKQADISTACYPSLDEKTVLEPSHVKAVLTEKMQALYFSRSIIPFKREITQETAKVPFYIHCGIYGYKENALKKFVKLPKSTLENLEKLEQLRALENGLIIKSILIEKAGPAIDTPADLLKARAYAKKIEKRK